MKDERKPSHTAPTQIVFSPVGPDPSGLDVLDEFSSTDKRLSDDIPELALIDALIDAARTYERCTSGEERVSARRVFSAAKSRVLAAFMGPTGEPVRLNREHEERAGVVENSLPLPCPFCGAVARWINPRGNLRIAVQCEGCDAIGPIAQQGPWGAKDIDQPAIDAWNRRAQR